MYGAISPPKLEPPPAQPITISGYSSNLSIAAFASSPIIDWWSNTWFKTEPKTYLYPFVLTATSTASDIAVPKEPGSSGFCSNIFLPALVVLLGEGVTSAPNTFIIFFLSGFCS